MYKVIFTICILFYSLSNGAKLTKYKSGKLTRNKLFKKYLTTAKFFIGTHGSNVRRNLHQTDNLLENVKKDIQDANGCTFVKYEGYTLYGHNDKTMDDLSLDECKDMCQFQIEWECNSFDYSENTRICYMTDASHLSHPDDFGEHWEADYYHKLCQQPISMPDESQCPSKYFRCKDNGVCIDDSLVCDGEDHCYDGSDEHQCTEVAAECWENEFHCPETSICIHSSLQCNGIPDCPLGKDELNCFNADCPNGFSCQVSGECLNYGQVCDHVTQCGDGSDERDCDYHCLEGESRCAGSSQCIPVWWLCDGIGDCDHSTDEINCN